MRTVLAFLFVNCFLAAANVLAAGVVFFGGRAALTYFPDQATEPWVWYSIGALAVGAAIGFCTLAVKLANPRSRT